MTLTKEQALARFEMFTEAADHLDGCVTDDATEQAEIPFVQREIRKQADKWLKKSEARGQQ